MTNNNEVVVGVLGNVEGFDWTKQLEELTTETNVSNEIRPICVLENGAVYQGEWCSPTQSPDLLSTQNPDDDLKSGRGVQIWENGSRYDGFWKAGMACGHGRLIHAEGDVYEGEWARDKANGFGVYSYFNGSKYEG